MAKVKGSKNWTKGEVQILLRMTKDGVSVNGISDSIGRSPAAVANKLSNIRRAVGTTRRKKVAVETPAASETIANTTRGMAQQAAEGASVTSPFMAQQAAEGASVTSPFMAKQAEEAPVISTFSNEQQEEIAKIVISAMTDALRFAREKIVEERQAKKKRGFFPRVFGSKHD